MHILLTLQTCILLSLGQKYCHSVRVEGCLLVCANPNYTSDFGLKVSNLLLLWTSKMTSWLFCSELHFIEETALAATYRWGICPAFCPGACWPQCEKHRSRSNFFTGIWLWLWGGYHCGVGPVTVCITEQDTTDTAVDLLLYWWVLRLSNRKCCLVKVCCSLVFQRNIFEVLLSGHVETL